LILKGSVRLTVAAIGKWRFAYLYTCAGWEEERKWQVNDRDARSSQIAASSELLQVPLKADGNSKPKSDFDYLPSLSLHCEALGSKLTPRNGWITSTYS
jgi:hypothetical protein